MLETVVTYSVGDNFIWKQSDQ